MSPRQRHPEIWSATYGTAFANHVRTELHDGQMFTRSIDGAKRSASACFDIADAAVEAYEDELDRIADAGVAS